MVDLVCYLTNSLFFDVSLLYYYINLRLLINPCRTSGDRDLSLSISLSCSFVTVSELTCCELFCAFVILLAILLPIKSSVVSSLF